MVAASYMFKRAHHNRILQVLQAFDPSVLSEAKCYFGGGTAIVLQLEEYRESVDIDFLCSDIEAYRAPEECHKCAQFAGHAHAYADPVRT